MAELLTVLVGQEFPAGGVAVPGVADREPERAAHERLRQQEENPTDRERLVALLESWGFERMPDDLAVQSLEGRQYVVGSGIDTGESAVGIGTGDGYPGFCCAFYFNADGTFISHGCWA
jgi:hypothetical protein